MALTKILTEGIKDGEILNVDIDDNASIAKSKLASLNILNTDVNANAGIVSTKLAKPIDFADTEKARFGAGNDFEIQHDGTNNILKSTTTAEIQLNYSAENMARFLPNGSCDLYYDNSRKLQTSANGVLIGATTQGHSSADDLTIEDAGGGDSGITIRSGTSGDCNIWFSDGTSGTAEYVGYIQYKHATDRFNFGTNAGTSMILDSSGRLLLGTSTEGFDTYGDDLTLATSGHTGITVRSGTTSRGSIYFSDGTSGDAEYQGYIQYNHDDGRLVFGTTATERLRIHSGGQIQLGGTSLSNISSFADDLVIGQSGSTAINGLTFCSTNSSGIRFHDTGDAGELEFNHSDNSFTTSADGLLKFRTNSAERMRIDSSGRVQIGGVTGPNNAKLFVAGTNSTNYMTFRNTSAGDGSGARWNNIRFQGTQSGGEVSDLVHLQANHDGTADDEKGAFEVLINDGNDGDSLNKKIRVDSDGLKFGSDTAAANALDDYEEGTYTPAFSTGMSGISYTLQYGNYVKIGKLVRFDFHIQVNGGVSNAAIIAFTLPFNSDAGVNGHRGSGVITYSNINDGNQGTTGVPALYIGTSSAQCYMNGTAWTGSSGSAQSNKYFIGGGTYHTP